MTRHTTRSTLGLCALVALAGCQPPPPDDPGPVHDMPQAVTGGPDREAQEIFTTRCVACHGASGGGDGIAAAALTPRPRNFHDPAWQSQRTDAEITRVILLGGAAVGKSPAMPPNPDLASKPAVAAELVRVLRAFR